LGLVIPREGFFVLTKGLVSASASFAGLGKVFPAPTKGLVVGSKGLVTSPKGFVGLTKPLVAAKKV
jgi:hypothetical protein